MSDSIIVFTDGAAKGNPGPAGWGAIVALPTGRVVELGGGEARATNNRMELAAPIEALRMAAACDAPVAVHTDSTYVINGVTKWVHGWRRNGWRTSSGGDVANRAQWEELLDLVATNGGARRVKWQYVRGHTGVPGNERADEIASGFAEGEPPDLYDGPRSDYPVSLEETEGTPSATEKKKASTGSRSRKAAHSYLSMVDGVVCRHRTWAECEGAVKGRSRARFKKAVSESDEKAILSSWGRSPSDIR